MGFRSYQLCLAGTLTNREVSKLVVFRAAGSGLAFVDFTMRIETRINDPASPHNFLSDYPSIRDMGVEGGGDL